MYVHTYTDIYMRTYTNVLLYVHTYLYTLHMLYMHTYIHTYIRTYICMYMVFCAFFSMALKNSITLYIILAFFYAQGVLEFSLAHFFAKMVSYSFLLWLPFYLKNTGNDPA